MSSHATTETRTPKRNQNVPVRVYVDTSQPLGLNFPLPTTFSNYENTRFLGHFGGGDGVRFRLPLVEQTVGSWSRTSGSLLRFAARHTRGITYAGRWFLPPSSPPPFVAPLLLCTSPHRLPPRHIRFQASPSSCVASRV